jgi:hypothetical protein
MLNLKWNFIVLFLRVDLNLLWHSRLVLYKIFWFQKSWKFSYYVPSMDKMNNGPPELVPFELLHLELGTMVWQFISRRDWLIDGWSFYVWLMDGWQWIQIRCFFDFWIRERFFSDPGTQTHIFEILVTIFCGKSTISLGEFAQVIFVTYSKIM